MSMSIESHLWDLIFPPKQLQKGYYQIVEYFYTDRNKQQLVDNSRGHPYYHGKARNVMTGQTVYFCTKKRSLNVRAREIPRHDELPIGSVIWGEGVTVDKNNPGKNILVWRPLRKDDTLDAPSDGYRESIWGAQPVSLPIDVAANSTVTTTTISCSYRDKVVNQDTAAGEYDHLARLSSIAVFGK